MRRTLRVADLYVVDLASGGRTSSKDFLRELAMHLATGLSRRGFLAGSLAAGLAGPGWLSAADSVPQPALIAYTLDLEMSRDYPMRGQREWDFRKGDLDDATKQYALEAGRIAHKLGAKIHYFCVGRVLEQPNVDWLKELIDLGHAIGNHTYDHVNVLATKPEEVQFRFQRSPWLIRGQPVPDILRANIEQTIEAMRVRLGVAPNGFRTPGGFATGLSGREDVQKMLGDIGYTWVSGMYPNHETGPAKTEPTPAVYQDLLRAQTAAQPFTYPTGIVEIPMSPISDVNAFRSNYWKREWFLQAIRNGVQAAIKKGECYDFLAHPSCLVVEDPGFESLKLVCQLVQEAGDRAKIVTLDEMAERAATK